SPYKDPIGLALYVEPTYGPKKRELEGKIILHKNFLDDRLVWAGNFSAAQEHDKFHGEWERAGELDFTTGVAYRFAPRWHAGCPCGRVSEGRTGAAGHLSRRPFHRGSARFARCGSSPAMEGLSGGLVHRRRRVRQA